MVAKRRFVVPMRLDARKFWAYLQPYYTPAHGHASMRINGTEIPSRLNGKSTGDIDYDYDIIRKIRSGQRTYVEDHIAERILQRTDLPFYILENLRIRR